jgi:hypothetical protein
MTGGSSFDWQNTYRRFPSGTTAPTLKQVWTGGRPQSRNSPKVRISVAWTVMRGIRSPRQPCFTASRGAGACRILASADGCVRRKR